MQPTTLTARIELATSTALEYHAGRVVDRTYRHEHHMLRALGRLDPFQVSHERRLRHTAEMLANQ